MKMMHRLALLLSTLAFCLVLASASASAVEAQSSYEAELDAAISHYFAPADQATARAIVACESGYGADIYNEYSGAYGPWQFMAATSYGLGFDHSAMADPWYSTWAAAEYVEIAGFYPWSCY